MLQDQRSIMLANEGYFVVEVGYNCQKYGQKSIWTMPEYPVEYFEAVIQKALKHPRNITQHLNSCGFNLVPHLGTILKDPLSVGISAKFNRSEHSFFKQAIMPTEELAENRPRVSFKPVPRRS